MTRKQEIVSKEIRIDRPWGTEIYMKGEGETVKYLKLNKESPQKVVNRLESEMRRGVTGGYKERIYIKGTGYRAQIVNEKLEISLGARAPYIMSIPETIKLKIKGAGLIIEGTGTSLKELRQYLSTIIELRPASKDKYTNKGVVKWTK